jgi:hypothetical protein
MRGQGEKHSVDQGAPAAHEPKHTPNMVETKCRCGAMVVLPWYAIEGDCRTFCADCAKYVQFGHYGQVVILPQGREKRR